MKKIKNFLLLALVAVSTTTLVSCEKDENEGSQKPSLEFIAGENLTTDDRSANVGESLSFRFQVTSNADSKSNIAKITVTRVANNVPTVAFDTTLSDDGPITKTLTLNALATAGSENFIFEATDKDGEKVSKTIVVTTVASFTERTTGVFYHIAGLKEGAFDIVSETVRRANEGDASKDLMNTDAAGATFTGSFRAGAGSNTTFIRNNSFDYTGATATSVRNQFALNAGVTSITNPAVGDIILVRLRGANTLTSTDYAVIKVTAVEPNFSTNTGTNRGRITFSFKK